MISLADLIRTIAAAADYEITTKVLESPGIKPPRRQPSFQNESSHSDYQKNYKRNEQEQGGGYKKVPQQVQEWRRKKRKKLKTNKL